MEEEKLAGVVRIWRLVPGKSYAVAGGEELFYVSGGPEDAILRAIRMTMPSTLAKVDIGGTLWVLESGDAEIVRMLEVGLAELNSSKPFSIYPTPLVGVLLWAAARLGVRYRLENEMAKAKGPVEFVFDAFGLGVIVFEADADRKLTFKSWTPTSGVFAFVETVFSAATKSIAAPIAHDEPPGGSAASSAEKAKEIVNNLAPTPKGAPDLGKAAEPVETQSAAAEDAAIASTVVDPDQIDMSEFPGMDEPETKPLAKSAAQISNDSLPPSSGDDAVSDLFNSPDFDDSNTPVSHGAEDPQEASLAEVEDMDEDDEEDPLAGAMGELTGVDVGQVSSPVEQVVPEMVGLQPGEPPFPTSIKTKPHMQALLKKLSPKNSDVVNKHSQNLDSKSVEQLHQIYVQLTGAKTRETVDRFQRLAAAGRREDIHIAILTQATQLLLSKQAG